MTAVRRVLPFLLGCLLWGCASGASSPAPALAVVNAWSRPVPQGGNGAVYLAVTNNAAEPDLLLAARCADAVATELHQVLMDGDVMKMQPVRDGLEVPGHGRLELAPAGHHLMIIDLSRDLGIGDRLEVVLEFEKAGEVTVRVPISIDAPADGKD